MQESQQNDSKQLGWYALWPWTRIFKTKKQTGSISVVLETGKRRLQKNEQTYKRAISRGQLANLWSHHVSPISGSISWKGPFNDVVCITQDPGNHEGTKRMPNKVSLFQAPNLEVDGAKQTAPTFNDF